MSSSNTDQTVTELGSSAQELEATLEALVSTLVSGVTGLATFAAIVGVAWVVLFTIHGTRNRRR